MLVKIRFLSVQSTFGYSDYNLFRVISKIKICYLEKEKKFFININRCNRGCVKTKPQCEHTEKIEQRAIELGHCFLLGDRYTKAFNAIDGSDIADEKK
jgi:prolyl-tRNA synthetase